MVRGLELFRDHFRTFADRYILIGGTACDLLLSHAGLTFRATRDLDIVLCLESLDAGFAKALWAFIKIAGYRQHETSTGRKTFYRFRNPADADYPTMLELFSRVPDALAGAARGTLTPIPVDDGISSFSAILLDGESYKWIHDGRREVDGVPIVGPEHLIPLKARAWLDLRSRRAGGDPIDSKDIRKHRNDVFRLYAIVDPEFRRALPGVLGTDMRRFVHEVRDETLDLKAFGLGDAPVESVLDSLRAMYEILEDDRRRE